MHRNSTRSIYDGDVVYYNIHGRRYCKQYYMPVDEDEQTRMQMLNGIYYSMLGQRLTTVTLDNPKKILDIGTGIGEWAVAMGEVYPDAEVIGTDIAKIQPSAVPLNVFFEVDDAEEVGGWAWPDNEFDFIHFRYMCGAFTSWKHVYQETFKHLKPGGWVEVLDFDDHKNILPFFSEETLLRRLMEALEQGTLMSGRPRSVTHLEPKFLEELGFVDVQCTTLDIAMGVWPDDEQMQKRGKHLLVALLLGLEAVCLRVLTEQMGWSPDDVRDLCETVAQEIWNLAVDPEKSQGFSPNLKVLVGRKPGGPPNIGDTGSARTMTVGESVAEGESTGGSESSIAGETMSGASTATSIENTTGQN